MQNQFAEVLGAYGPGLDQYTIEPLGNGHINHTFLVKTTAKQPYVLQKINTAVFKNPAQIAHNWKLAKEHIEKHDPDYAMLSYIPTSMGKLLYVDSANQWWRLTAYFDHSVCYETLDSIEKASKTARAFGKFASLLAKADVSNFYEILPRFHDLSYRQMQFDEALAKASSHRLLEAKSLISFLNEKRWITHFYEKVIRLLPRRIVHMDAKISNVLFDSQSNNVLSLIDLDTLMPATLLSDAGDMIRSMSCAAAEDEQNRELIKVRPGFVEAIVENYAGEIADILPVEKQLLPFGGIMLVYMQALRFLTDYLENDHYYHIRYPDHNLVRATNQATLLDELLREPLIHQKFPW